jgi:hypothetical protein
MKKNNARPMMTAGVGPMTMASMTPPDKLTFFEPMLAEGGVVTSANPSLAEEDEWESVLVEMLSKVLVKVVVCTYAEIVTV